VNEKMNAKNFYARFKGQYEDFQWEKLNSDFGFKEALAEENYDKAGRLADRILIGETKKISAGRKIKKEYDETQRLLKKLLA
jgi:hypothetical protein